MSLQLRRDAGEARAAGAVYADKNRRSGRDRFGDGECDLKELARSEGRAFRGEDGGPRDVERLAG